MFWRKDFWTKERNEFAGLFNDLEICKSDKVPMWESHEIVLVDGFNDSLKKVETRLELIEKRQNLILKELGKEYVPEKNVTEPAKLVEKKTSMGFDLAADDFADKTRYILFCQSGTGDKETKPKKKRGRPKGSKTKK